MQLKLKYTALLLSLCAFTACNEEDVLVDPSTGPNNTKTPIELSIGGVDGAMQNVATRATSVITDEVDPLTFSNFDATSKLFMVMKSEWVSLPSGYEDFNYGGSHDTKYCVTRGEVAANQDIVIFNTGLERYWDDAHARSSKLSIWAFTAPGATYENCTFGTSDQIQGWKTTAITPTINTWSVTKSGTEQISSDLVSQNLCFSNNIVDYTSESKTDRRLGFKTPEKKFDSGKLVFYHAMSKITIHIKKGNGFSLSDPFAFKTNTTIALTNYNISGTFDIADGIFSSTTAGDISKISTVTTAAGDAFTLQALVIPGTTHSTNEGSIWKKNNTNTSMSFTINDNLYLISQDELITALRNNSANNGIDADATTVKMEAGKHYIFTFTIGKKQIDNLTAQVVNWKEVEAEEFEPSNAHVTVSVKESEGTKVTGSPTFDLYRAPGTLYSGATTVEGYNAYADYNWEKGYEKSTGLAETSTGTGTYTTEWYWPNNNTFYHLRTISPTSESIGGNDATTYISMTGGVIKQGSVTAKDYIWGAPFKAASPTPDGYSFQTGFCNNNTKSEGQLYKAIGATKENITLIQHHMTAQVFVDLETTNLSDAVDLTGATVQLVNIAQNAQLYLGNGLITTYSNFGNVSMTADAHATASPIPAYDYSYGVLPQQLSNTNGTVGIKITTTDGNVYIIDDLRTIKTSGTNITEWLPGKKYYYKFVLKKTGITNLEATIVDWENVTADNETVQIK